jgi:hypothetical protein
MKRQITDECCECVKSNPTIYQSHWYDDCNIVRKDTHRFMLSYDIWCSTCDGLYHTNRSADSPEDAIMILKKYFDFNSKYGPKKHFPTQFTELMCCAPNIPTEILTIIINSIWLMTLIKDIFNIKLISTNRIVGNVQRIVFNKSDDSDLSRRMFLPPIEPHPNMRCILSGFSFGKYQPAYYEQNIYLTGEFLISAVRVDNKIIKRNAIFNIPNKEPEDIIMQSMSRKVDGFYIGNIPIVLCDQRSYIILDHVFVRDVPSNTAGMMSLTY